MSEVRQALLACMYNFRRWRRSARVAIVFSLAFILCFLLTERTVSVARDNDAYVQVLEPFVWTFGDGRNILLVSLLLVLLLADMPFISAGTPFFLIRSSRRAWLVGQALYILGATFLYLLFILASTCVLCMPVAFAGDQWSRAAALMGFAGLGEKNGIPADTTLLRMGRPAECTAVIFVLVLLYMLLLGSIMLGANIRKGRSWSLAAAVVFSAWGLLLEPAFFLRILGIPQDQMYRANVLAGWLSPLNQATYQMHSFGYNALPRLWQSMLLFAAASLVAFAVALQAVRGYQFQFTGNET